MRFFMTFSYDGSNFSGYQKQPRERTVQKCLEDALKEIKKLDAMPEYLSSNYTDNRIAQGQRQGIQEIRNLLNLSFANL